MQITNSLTAACLA